eukprot:5628409-Amphidinium_carterae.1
MNRVARPPVWDPRNPKCQKSLKNVRAPYPAPANDRGEKGPGEPVQLTPDELFVSSQPGAVAVRAMFKELPLKMEDSDEFIKGSTTPGTLRTLRQDNRLQRFPKRCTNFRCEKSSRNELRKRWLKRKKPLKHTPLTKKWTTVMERTPTSETTPGPVRKTDRVCSTRARRTGRGSNLTRTTGMPFHAAGETCTTHLAREANASPLAIANN